jgi:hypothetical protein
VATSQNVPSSVCSLLTATKGILSQTVRKRCVPFLTQRQHSNSEQERTGVGSSRKGRHFTIPTSIVHRPLILAVSFRSPWSNRRRMCDSHGHDPRASQRLRWRERNAWAAMLGGSPSSERGVVPATYCAKLSIRAVQAPLSPSSFPNSKEVTHDPAVQDDPVLGTRNGSDDVARNDRSRRQT